MTSPTQADPRSTIELDGILAYLVGLELEVHLCRKLLNFIDDEILFWSVEATVPE